MLGRNDVKIVDDIEWVCIYYYKIKIWNLVEMKMDDFNDLFLDLIWVC